MPAPFQWQPPNFLQAGLGMQGQGQGPMAPGAGQPPPQPQGPQAAPPGGADPGADFGDLDPDALMAMADAYGISLQEAATKMRLMRAQMLASTPQAQGRQVGDVFVASNPMEVAGRGAQRAIGMRGMRSAEQRMSALDARTVNDAMGGYNLYRPQGKKLPPVAPPPDDQPFGF